MERFLTNDRFISHHRNKLDVKDFEVDKLNMAYLDMKFDQFYIHLKNENNDDNLVIKTLKEIEYQLHDATEIYSYACVHTELLAIIINHLKDNINSEIRINSSFCFKQFCKLNPSKEIINTLGVFKIIQSVLDDKEPLVRLNVVEGLIIYASFRQGKETLLENDLLEKIIIKVENEESELVLNNWLILTNEILHAENGSKIALNNKFIQILKKHINHKKTKIRCSVFINLGSLSISEEGKEACTNEGEIIINSLVQLKEQIELLKVTTKPKNFYELDSINMLISLTRFQNTVSILKRGKVEILGNNGLEYYLQLLKIVKNEQVIINTLQVLGNTSEEPGARKFMNSHLSELEIFAKSTNEFIKAQAEFSLKVITWIP